jgi:hypothetical protein
MAKKATQTQLCGLWAADLGIALDRADTRPRANASSDRHCTIPNVLIGADLERRGITVGSND